jgi:hypothetical protein
MNVVKNMELAHYVDRLQDEDDELRQLMGWLSSHGPQLRMMIEAFKHQYGEALGAKKVGAEVVRIRGRSEISHNHQKPTTKMPYLRNRLDTTLAPPVFPPQTNKFQKPIKFESDLGNKFFGKKGEKPSEDKPQPRENLKPKPKPKPFHC